MRQDVARFLDLEDDSVDESIPESNDPASVELPSIPYHQFVLGKRLGSGSYGKVFRARMQQEDRDVAVKFLRKSLWMDNWARQSLLQEVALASRIEHQAITSYFGVGRSPHGATYIVSEFIDGTPLAEQRSMPFKQFVDYLREICFGVAAAISFRSFMVISHRAMS